MNSAYEIGGYSATQAYGVDKLAFKLPTLRSVGEGVRNVLVGDPALRARFKQQLSDGGLWGKGGVFREGLWPSDRLGKAMTVVGTGLGLHQALNAESGQRGSALGGLAGGTLGGAMLYPYGLLGSMAGSIAGSMAGSALGGAFDKKQNTQDTAVL
jgi:hypothetical protein